MSALSEYQSPAVSMEVITPDYAELLLQGNENNRRVSEEVVKKYARDIASGDWKVNGDAIRIAKSGQVLDGQHRLFAVIKAKRPMTSLIVRNLDPEVQTTIDTGKPRRLTDVLAMRGEKYHSTLASAARLVLVFDVEKKLAVSPGFTPSHSELLEVIDANPQLSVSAQKGTFWAREVSIPATTAAGLHFIFGRIDAEQADLFFTRLATGAELDADSPILSLRRWLELNTRKRTKMPSWITAAVTIKAWNAWRQNRPMKLMKFNTANEPFPQPE
jgi:hypothetical protein